MPYLPVSLSEKLPACPGTTAQTLLCVLGGSIVSHDALSVGQGSQSPGKVRKGGGGWMKDGASTVKDG